MRTPGKPPRSSCPNIRRIGTSERKVRLMKTITLEETEFSNGLDGTYENIARRLGAEVDGNTQYDCCRVCVAGNIQDAWISHYSASIRERHPDMAEADVGQQVMSLLLVFGAKVDPALAPCEARADDGFVSSAAA